jgi:hypothetical protein
MFDSIVFEFVSMCDGILGQSRSSLFQSFVFGYVCVNHVWLYQSFVVIAFELFQSFVFEYV